MSNTIRDRLAKYNGQKSQDRSEKFQAKRLYQAHLDRIAKYFTTTLKKHRIPIRCNSVDVFDDLLPLDMDLVLKIGRNQEVSGRLWPNQIDCMMETIGKHFHDDTRRFNISGPPQSGKTGSMNCLTILPLFNTLIGGDREQVVMTFIINRHTHEAQGSSSRTEFLDLYGHFLSFSDIKGKMEMTLSIYHDLVYGSVLREYGFSSYEIDQFFKNPIRTTPSLVDAVNNIMARLHEHKVDVITMIDEDHYRSEEFSTLHQMLKGVAPFKDSIQTSDVDIETLKKVAEQINKSSMFIGVSATPTDLEVDPQTWYKVQLYPGDGYCGLRYHYGVDLQKHVEGFKELKVFDFEDVANDPKFDNPEIKVVDIRRFNSETSFDKNVWDHAWNHDGKRMYWFTRYCYRNNFEPTWAMYREMVCWSVAKLISHLFAIHRNDSYHCGVFLRFGNVNSSADAFIRMTKGLLPPEIVIIKAYGGAIGYTSMTDYIRRNNPNNQPYLVVLTAQGRCGDTFGSECRYFIDLTEATANDASLVQGTPGRASGCGKESTVFISKRNKEFIYQNQSNWGFPVKGSTHTTAHYDQGPGPVFLSREICQRYPKLMDLLESLEDQVSNIGSQSRKTIRMSSGVEVTRLFGGDNWPIDISFFTEEVFRMLEINCHILWPGREQLQLLRFNNVYDNNAYDMESRTTVKVGLRYATKSGHIKDLVRMPSNHARREEGSKILLRPQIWYQFDTTDDDESDTNKVKIVGMGLLACNDMKTVWYDTNAFYKHIVP